MVVCVGVNVQAGVGKRVGVIVGEGRGVFVGGNVRVGILGT